MLTDFSPVFTRTTQSVCLQLIFPLLSLDNILDMLSNIGCVLSTNNVILSKLSHKIDINTSLAALGALSHRLQHLTTRLIQHGQCGMEIG